MRLRQEEVKAYFSTDGTVSHWWHPEGYRDKYHFYTEKRILASELTIDPTWRVLDVGCGQGRYTIWFARRASRVTGVDISQEMLNLCRRNADAAGVSDKIDLVQADVENLPRLQGDMFDLVSCMGTFVHLPDLTHATTNMVGRLKPGGRFVFTFASAESLHGRLVSAYFSNPRVRALLGAGESFAQVASPLRLDHTMKVLETSGLSRIRVFGIGLLFLFVRPELRDNAGVRFLRRLSIVEERLKPYYSAHRLVRLSATILGISTRAENEKVGHRRNGD